MKKFLLPTIAALSIGAAVNVSALTSFSLNFDSAASNTFAQSFAPVGFNINFGTKTQKLDEFGDFIPGSDYWTIDSGDVLATDPNEYNFGSAIWGNAPSGLNTLNAHDGPLLLSFDQPFNLTLFSTTLDNSTLGDTPFSSILFYDANDNLLSSVDFNEQTPLAQVSTGGPISGVSKIVLPGNAFYDDINVSGQSVPEPSTVALLSLAAGAIIFRLRSRRNLIG